MGSQVKKQRRDIEVHEGGPQHSETRVPFFHRRPVDPEIEDETTAPPSYTVSAGGSSPDANGIEAQMGITGP